MNLFRFSFSSIFSLLVMAAPVSAQSTPDFSQAAEEFPVCLQSLASNAQTQGLTQTTIDSILLQAQFTPKVLEYDRRQPEFVETFPTYMNKRVTPWRVTKGLEKLTEHKAFLRELTQTYGIPGHYLVAFWGLETNYGNYKGKMPIIDSLATLACDQRRSEFFTEQLVLALKLMEREQLPVEQMLGSWAGAMGHTQFMPSAYLNYAIDGDGDGRVDLWNSEKDGLASAANFLHHLGWQPGVRWGREVRLSDNFDYVQTGRTVKKSVTDWGSVGVARANGDDLGQSDISASLLVPAGHQGPAFLVYQNYKVIMRWNNSESYAIAVGHLADRLSGGGKLVAPLPDLPKYSLAQMKSLQQRLNSLGFDVGKPDGIMGPATRNGIRNYQASQNMVADGYPDPQTMKLLLIDEQAGQG